MTGDPRSAPGARHLIVVMGVSGCGKSTVGAALAASIGAEFLDGDSLHPQDNIDKMASGTPLSDADRAPWLALIGRRLAASGGSLVIACSALKCAYRDIIRSGDASVVFVHLHGSRELLQERTNSRPGHFMPPSLLDSQLAALEPLQADEAGKVVDIAGTVDQMVADAGNWLGCTASSRSGTQLTLHGSACGLFASHISPPAHAATSARSADSSATSKMESSPSSQSCQ